MPKHPGKLLIFLLLAAMLAACVQFSTPSAQNPAASTSTETPQPTGTRPPPTATANICRETRGKVTDYSIPSEVLPKPVPVKVYTPACYDGSIEYPVLYMLHGMTFLDDQWVRLGLTDAADALIASKQIAPMIIVMPQEDASLSDPSTSQYGNALIEEVIPWVDANFSTCVERGCRAIGGLSRGGNWAVRLGFTDWQLFSAIGAHSTPLFVGDLGRLSYLVRQMPSLDQTPQIYIDMGQSDENSENILQFNDELDRLNIPHEFFQFPGYHDESYWSAHVEDYLRWYAAVFAANYP